MTPNGKEGPFLNLRSLRTSFFGSSWNGLADTQSGLRIAFVLEVLIEVGYL
jgi:hypothetical protein